MGTYVNFFESVASPESLVYLCLVDPTNLSESFGQGEKKEVLIHYQANFDPLDRTKSPATNAWKMV